MRRRSAVPRPTTLPRSILLLLAVSALAVLATVSLFLAVEKRVTAAPVNDGVVSVGGLRYEAMLARPVNAANRVDRRIVAGLAEDHRQRRRGQILFGVFLSIRNDSMRALRSADRIELRDQRDHLYHALDLPAANPYAYAPSVVPSQTRIPRQGSAANDNLAATGKLVLFRIPAAQYENGMLELVIHRPDHPREAASLVISAAPEAN
jgi:hypothetical protein